MPIVIPPVVLKVVIGCAATLGVSAAKEVINQLKPGLNAAKKQLDELIQNGCKLNQSLQPKGVKFDTPTVAPVESDKSPSSRNRR